MGHAGASIDNVSIVWEPRYLSRVPRRRQQTVGASGMSKSQRSQWAFSIMISDQTYVTPKRSHSEVSGCVRGCAREAFRPRRSIKGSNGLAIKEDTRLSPTRALRDHGPLYSIRWAQKWATDRAKRIIFDLVGINQEGRGSNGDMRNR